MLCHRTGGARGGQERQRECNGPEACLGLTTALTGHKKAQCLSEWCKLKRYACGEEGSMPLKEMGQWKTFNVVGYLIWFIALQGEGYTCLILRSTSTTAHPLQKSDFTAKRYLKKSTSIMSIRYTRYSAQNTRSNLTLHLSGTDLARVPAVLLDLFFRGTNRCRPERRGAAAKSFRPGDCVSGMNGLYHGWGYATLGRHFPVNIGSENSSGVCSWTSSMASLKLLSAETASERSSTTSFIALKMHADTLVAASDEYNVVAHIPYETPEGAYQGCGQAERCIC